MGEGGSSARFPGDAPCPLLSMDLQVARNKASRKRASRETSGVTGSLDVGRIAPYFVAIAWQTWVSQKEETFKNLPV